jgi:hypothetical protein
MAEEEDSEQHQSWWANRGAGAERRLLLITFLGGLGLVLIIALAVVAARSSHS